MVCDSYDPNCMVQLVLKMWDGHRYVGPSCFPVPKERRNSGRRSRCRLVFTTLSDTLSPNTRLLSGIVFFSLLRCWRLGCYITTKPNKFILFARGYQPIRPTRDATSYGIYSLHCSVFRPKGGSTLQCGHGGLGTAQTYIRIYVLKLSFLKITDPQYVSLTNHMLYLNALCRKTVHAL